MIVGMSLMPDRMHDQRHRAESFGGVAEAYDRFRPSYPDALIDDLVAPSPANALDVGCGTGKAARLLAARGVTVLGVEVDPQMAAVARRSGLEVEVAPFEQWDPRGRTFDLVFSGQAWHWIEPSIGVPKAAGVLRPGGRLALFWNTVVLDAGIRGPMQDVYRRLAPGTVAESRRFDGREPPYADDLRTAGVFGSVDVRSYEWDREYAADEWVQMVQTHSDHVVMPADQRARLIEEVTATIDAHGGVVRAHYVTQTILAELAG